MLSVQFGVSPAHEKFQRRQHEVLEGLTEQEYVMDDTVEDRSWNQRFKTMTQHDSRPTESARGRTKPNQRQTQALSD